MTRGWCATTRVRWHMYVTARDAGGSPGCGVVGHAVSEDLTSWEVQPPLSSPTGVFEWLEVISVVRVEGRWVLLFSCLLHRDARRARGCRWSLVGPGGRARGPGRCVCRSAGHRRVADVGKAVDHLGAAYLLAFRNRGPDGAFVGGVTDPMPVTWRDDGRGLALALDPAEP